MFAVQKELLSGLPGHRACQSHLPPHTMITIRKASASAHLRVERDTEVSECLFYVGQICIKEKEINFYSILFSKKV